MSIISRLTTWSIGQVLKAADLNGEFNNITNLLNNLDAATTTWTNVKVATLNSTTATTLKGTTTNDSAAAGNIGEYISSTVGVVASGGTGVWADLTSIALTAGDWDITLMVTTVDTAATWSHFQIGTSTTAGNSSTGLTDGTTAAHLQIANSATAVVVATLSVPALRVSLSAASTTYYLKWLNIFSAGTPSTNAGRISARRVR